MHTGRFVNIEQWRWSACRRGVSWEIRAKGGGFFIVRITSVTKPILPITLIGVEDNKVSTGFY